MKAFAAVFGLLLLGGTALAAETGIDRTRLYASSPELCQRLETDGGEVFQDPDAMVFSFSEGIVAMEHHCDFLDIKSRPDSDFLFISAVCEFPGEVYPDSFAVAPYDDTSIQVVSAQMNVLEMAGVFDSSEEGGPAGTQFYHRCDNLSEIPFD